ncbi:MAG: hypothetical protein LAT56_00260 [Wenzhouxiangella sp.]|nr:hypothetical protein [Wenzhouxiangella sp.]
MENLKWYHNEQGKPSSMRILTMLGGVVGTVVIFSYLIGLPLGVDYGTEALFAGAGMIVGGEGFKAAQSRGGH